VIQTGGVFIEYPLLIAFLSIGNSPGTMCWDQLSVEDLSIETGIEAPPEEMSHTPVVHDIITATSAITSADVTFALDERR
jgi:hypothetical protein